MRIRFYRIAAGVIVSAALGAGLAACVVNVRQARVEPLSRAAATGTHVRTPVKAHLLDGSTIVFGGGVSVGRDSLVGAGTRFDLRLRSLGMTHAVPLDSVAGMETYRTRTDVAASVVLSAGATALGALGTTALLVAIFGSCPTVYSDSAGTAVLEAESFSYSIAPLFESRDVDRLGVQPDAAGIVRLEVRNEALETHFINHMELLEVSHAPGDFVLPDPSGHPILVRSMGAPARATDRSGRDVLVTLAAADHVVYETPAPLLRAAHIADMEDHIDLAFPSPAGRDSVAVVLRLRNSLLTTILLYDVMLASQGAAALDWLGSGLDQVGNALELGQWYTRHMGLRVSVLEDGTFRMIGRIGDTGPIAWKDLAFMVPIPAGDSVHVRLSFVRDAWRIDRVAIADGAERPEVRTLPVARVSSWAAATEPEALHALGAPDERYLETTPGQRFFMEFDAGTAGTRTFLLASQGYYTEWIRPDWIRATPQPGPFQPSDDLILQAIGKWRLQRTDFEKQFYETRIPVR